MAPTRTGSVRKRGTRWQARLQRPDGTTTSSSFPTCREAERWVRDQAGGKSPRHPAEVHAEGPTLRTWAAQWEEEATGHLRASTRARVQSAMRTHILPLLGDHVLTDLTASDIRRWLTGLGDTGLSPASATRTFRVLSSCLLVAASDGLIATSPATGVRPPQIRRREQRYLSAGEVHLLANAIDPRYRALVLVGAWCGLRIGEMTGLRVRSVNPLKQTLNVVEQIVEVGGRLVPGEPKSHAGVRTVPVPRHVMQALAPHLAGKTPDALVFTAPEGGPIRRTLWAKRFWQPAVTAAGLEPLRVHDMRHTAVGLWLAAGATPLEVTKRAGHSSSAVILDVYGHLDAASQDQLTARLEAMAAQVEAAS
ncbi:MAG: tyrosine-type recombinase/integrase [Acidimicrobiales bacterium]